jgi:hypothetical protein
MPAKQRLQAYVDPEIAEEVRRRAEIGRRPESWELEDIIRRGLQPTQPDPSAPTQ